jgi:hypothetical protein
MNSDNVEFMFRGKSWMDWLRGTLLGAAAIGLLVVGIAEVRGFRDANGDIRHDAVIPCLTASPIVAALSVMFIVRALARSQPIIQLYREGIICRYVGNVNGIRVPSKLALLFELFSGNGFRQSLFRFEWQSLTEASISGGPMTYVFTVHGYGIDQHGTTATILTLEQHEFGASIHAVAHAVNTAIGSPEIRAELPTWHSSVDAGMENQPRKR